jgi:hypothetical protein
MNINALKFGLACAISASVLWVICSLLVMALPSMMLSMSSDMLHMQLTDMGWHLTLIGAVKGLVAWFIAAGVAGWLLAATYNRLL